MTLTQEQRDALIDFLLLSMRRDQVEAIAEHHSGAEGHVGDSKACQHPLCVEAAERFTPDGKRKPDGW